jgi:membrane protease YdiL (CAAX protease family)
MNHEERDSAAAPARARSHDSADEIPSPLEVAQSSGAGSEAGTSSPTERVSPIDDVADDVRVPWGWSDVALFVVFVLIAGVAITWGLVLLAVALFGAKSGDFTGSSTSTAKSVLLLLSQGLVDGSSILFLFVMLRSRSEAPFWRSIGWRALHLEGRRFQSSALQCLGGGALLAMVVSFVGGFFNSKESLPIEQLLQAPVSILLFGVLGVLVAPLVEETIFRGFLYPVMARQWGMTAGIVITGSLFGLLHAAQLWGGWGQIGLLIFVGILLTWVRARSGTVTASYFVHLGYNGLQLLGYAAYTIGKLLR